jgi:hypothetical protein
MYFLLAFLTALFFVILARVVRSRMTGEPFAPEDPAKIRRELEEFKSIARKVNVPLQDCKVLSNSFVQDELKSHNWRIQALDSLSGDGMSNVRQVNVQQSQLVYRIPEGQVNYDYASSVIYMERTTLLMKIEMQKETTLFIDGNDRSKYYFDLEFLEPKEY